MSEHWQFWIDVGGTFTDCIGVDPQGSLRQHKTLSSGIVKGTIDRVQNACQFDDVARSGDPNGFWDGAAIRFLDESGNVQAETAVVRFSTDGDTVMISDAVDLQPGQRYEIDAQLPAPVLGIRWLLGLSAGRTIPIVRVRFGTTRGTNALLTRTGARTALVTTKGFADVPLIGNQDRPRLFDLAIRKPEPLFETVAEVDERVAADGQIIRPLDEQQARSIFESLRDHGIESIAICLLNAWIEPKHEMELAALAREFGWTEVSYSYEVSPQIRFVPRCDTTVLDAYLNPVLRSYLATIQQHLDGSQILIMTSTGGLVDSRAFRGRDSILSGPAGGVVGFAHVAASGGFDQAIGFDMGGTSTDVARFSGQFEYENETTKAGIRIMTPTLAIETVAAGGGSICGFDGVRLRVGPDSAGADPGPACYGSNGPLTVTDLNVFLGRVLPEYFPFVLDRKAVKRRLVELRNQMAGASAWNKSMSLQTLAEGLLQIANDNMVQAIRKVSVAKGYDPADHVLVCFGGAGGQHACSIARSLGIPTILLHPLAGILSAWGMGQANVKSRRTASVLKPLTSQYLSMLAVTIESMSRETMEHVRCQGVAEHLINDPIVELELRYAGTESVLPVSLAPVEQCREEFEKKYQRQFGYTRPNLSIEIASVSVESTSRTGVADETPYVESTPHAAVADGTTWTVFNGQSLDTSVYLRASLQPGSRVRGPAIICEPTSTILIEPDCEAVITGNGSVLISVRQSAATTSVPSVDNDEADPVLVELFSNQFVSIAEQMGEMLRRTSVSTNVRERLDYSCALFDADGHLVVNAPHVPVHLGAMGETVRAIMEDHRGTQDGDVFVTNDPYRGGSHLPDVTVVTPVFADQSVPSFFVANRAHHAEIGGIVPGSMPPFSKCLAEEGVLIRSRHLIQAGSSLESEVRTLLSSGKYPSRSVDDNIADLAAQAAANACGAVLLQQLCKDRGAETVQKYMRLVQWTAERKMRLALSRMENRTHAFQDQLDNGSVIRVSIVVKDDSATVDFTGTAGVHPGNLNANRAITTAAVLYVFRCLLNDDVPLNSGVLAPLKLIVPAGLLNPNPGTTPQQSPAIVGGNVETSQRIVDVLLGALGLAAASQGTMNNLTFGDDTFGYYETICGGAGATPNEDGADAVHTHMTNTRLTDVEVFEQRYPVRLRQFCIRKGSGGVGRFRGGNGIVREIEFLQELQVSMLSQRRTCDPWGLNSGGAAAAGRNWLIRLDGVDAESLPGAFSHQFKSGDILRIETPGGGGFGTAGV
jgi:5-oxoprolinase (ATP-hydrolysing)